jgi:hypothetical protein
MSMYGLFLGLAALCAAAAAALIWYERTHGVADADRSPRSAWAGEREFVFRHTDPALKAQWHRGGLADVGPGAASEVAHGSYFGVGAYVFDVAAQTFVALARPTSSGVLVDLRTQAVPAPSEPGMDPLGAVGPRVLYTNNAEVARRIVDRRLIALAEQAPAHVEKLWNEGAWTLAALPLNNDPADLDEALEVVRRFGDLLRVLPPEGHARVLGAVGPRDPGQAHPVSGRPGAAPQGLRR